MLHAASRSLVCNRARVFNSEKFEILGVLFSNPRDPITLSKDDWGLQSPPQQGI